MKTKLVQSYSSNSLANLARNYSLKKKDHPQGEINHGFQIEEVEFEESFDSENENSHKGKKGTSSTTKDSQWWKAFLRRKHLVKRFPFLKWGKEYNKEKAISDLIAGLTVGLTILPQGLAYAKIANLPPQIGLYSSFVGCFVYIFLGGNNVATVGPTAIMGIITLSYTQGKPPEYAIFLTLVTGLVLLLMGIFQLGFITAFISVPVISGFTSAAALTICSTQIKPLLGLGFQASGFRDTIIKTFQHLHETSRNDALLSLGCSVVLIFMQHLQSIFSCFTKERPKWDRILWFISTARSVIVIVACTIFFTLIDISTFPVQVVGSIEPGLPTPKPPAFSISPLSSNSSLPDEERMSLFFLSFLKEDLSALIVLPFLALMEHVTILKRFTGSRMMDPSQEMIAVGMTNILGSFFSSMPVTGSFSRSTVNAASGAVSPLGGLITGTLVLLALQFLTPYFYYIPSASLAAVIVCAVIFTVDFSISREMWSTKRMDLIPWSITFLVSLFVALEAGILSGLLISLIFLLYYAARPAIRIQRAETRFGKEFVIIGLDRSLTFPSVEYIKYMVSKAGNVWAKGSQPVVIDCHHIQFVDFSASQGIRDLFLTFSLNNQPLILWKAKPSVARILTGLMPLSPNISIPYFLLCSSEQELESLIDGDNCSDSMNEEKPIEFTVVPR